MTFLDYKTALVTGASAGIGATIVETLRRNNLDVHALSRQLRLDVSGKRVRVTEICPDRTETEIFGLALGKPDAAGKTFFDGYETLQPLDVADAVAYAIDAPAHVNVGLIEIMPTFQVPGGMQFTRRPT